MKTKFAVIVVLLTFVLLRAGVVSAQQHEYVDLGLPSGTLWATCNIGAENPWDYGEYFAWGETTTKLDYDWSTYTYVSGNDKPTKYCNDASFGYNGFVDNLTVLQPSDDVVSELWGSEWCMPTSEQWDELHNKCAWKWITRNGKKGCEVKGPNGNTIFLPAAGKRDAWCTTPCHIGEIGYYWSSSLCTDRPCNAWYLYFGSGTVGASNYFRFFGLTVRAVQRGK